MLDAFIVLSLPLFLLSLWVVCSATGHVTFKRRWPAISDEEFVARCSPGTDPERALKVRRIVAEQLGMPYEHIYPEQRFVEDLYCD